VFSSGTKKPARQKLLYKPTRNPLIRLSITKADLALHQGEF